MSHRGQWLWAAVCRAMALLALSGLLVLLWQSLLNAPARLRADSVRIALEPGGQVVVGRHELAAPHAAIEHLLIARLDGERWTLRNLAPAHGAEVRIDGVDQPLRSHALRRGERVYAGSTVLAVAAVQPYLELRLAGTDRVWRYDGASMKEGSLRAELLHSEPCSTAGFGARLRHAWNRWAPGWMTMPSSMKLGGEASCGQQIPVQGLPAGAAWVERKGDTYVLRATHETARRICVSERMLAAGCAEVPTLFEAAVDLGKVQRLWVGRTGFKVELDEQRDHLQLLPTGRVGWVADPTGSPSGSTLAATAEATMTASSHDIWRLPAVPMLQALLPHASGWWGRAAQSPLVLPALGVAVMALAMAVWVRLRRWGLGWPGAVAFGLGCGMAGLAALGYWLGEDLGEAWRLALLSTGCAAILCMPACAGWAWLATMAMAAMGLTGSLLQLQLGVQGADAGAWQYFNRTTSLLAAAMWGLWVCAWWLRGVTSGSGRWEWPGMMRIEGWITLLVALVFAAMGLQAAAGSEEGVFGLQPVELAKFALVMLGAHALAMRLEWAHHRGWNRWRLWLRFLAPMGLFLAIVGLALGLLNDFSPLLLIGAWLIGILVAWSIAAGNVGGLLAAAITLTMALGAFQWATQPEGLGWLQAHGFYADRFQVMADLPRHPHSGEQVHRALQLASQGGAQGHSGVAAWRVPAIQDDMLPALLLGRYGYHAAVGLWILQLVYLFTILALGWRALRAAGPGDHRRRWLLQLGFFVTWGAAGLLAGHLVLSWGTVTAALPVMGQPLPLISAGGSILVLLLAPLHVFLLSLDAAVCTAEQRQLGPISGNKAVR